jgi:imidazolonepropionase-like amidohydrolase
MANDRSNCRFTVLRVVLPILGALLLPWSTAPAQGGPDDVTSVQMLEEEVAIATLLEPLQAAPSPEILVLRNVQVVDPVDRTTRAGQSIVMSLGTIVWVGDRANEPETGPDAYVIDGRGRFAAPGLTDMHVHSASASSYLLNLAHGVTTIREMAGFPWMLAVRDAVNAGRMIGPTSYVAGPIINYAPFGGFAVVAREPLAARTLVRRHAACGYDFIKVHNVMPRAVFIPIAEEARRVGLDLIGHVPRRTPVKDVVALGMRTMEHLKGFIDNGTMQAGDTNYAAAVGDSVWSTPTLYAFRRPAAIERAALASVAARWVPARVRAEWVRHADEPESSGVRLSRNAAGLAARIARTLGQYGGRILAGTDAAYNPYQVMGVGLIEEMKLLQAAGLDVPQVLQAATSEPASAMRMQNTFGRILPGARGDVVLLTANPIDDPQAYAVNEGVIVRGRWLERPALDTALAALANLYATRPARQLTPAHADTLATRAEVAVERGFVFNARTLNGASGIFRRLQYADQAGRLDRLAIAPTSGPCASIQP